MRFILANILTLIAFAFPAFAQETFKFAFLAPDRVAASNAAIFNGAADALKTLESRFGKKFELVYISADSSVPKQLKQLANLYIEGYKGALIVPAGHCDAQLSKTLTKLAADSFYCIELGAETCEDGYLHAVGTDPELRAKMISSEIARLSRGKKMDTLLYFYAPAPSSVDLTDKAALTKLLPAGLPIGNFEKIAADLKIKKSVAIPDYSVYAKAHAEEILRYDNYGEIFLSPAPLSNAHPIKPDTDRVFAMSIGALPQFEPYLATGQLNSCIYDDFYGWGYFAARALADIAVEKIQPSLKTRLLPPLLSTPKNVADFSADWRKWVK